jgi:glycerol-3-phosphate O-acyltransferase
MKNIKRIQSFNEHLDNLNIHEEELINQIEDIISNEVYLRNVPYSMQDGAQEKDPDSITDAAKEIVKMLKEKGLI